MFIQKVSRIFLIGLVFFVILSAHWDKNYLNYPVHFLGLDVPMTPFTADMTLMLSKDVNKEAYYTKKFILWYQTGFEDFYPLNAEDLGWYEFKAPFQWWSECTETNQQCPLVLYYLCRSIEDHVKSPVLSWRLVMKNAEITKPVDGLGLEYKCPLR